MDRQPRAPRERGSQESPELERSQEYAVGYPDFFSEETVVCGLRAADRDGCFREMLRSPGGRQAPHSQESELALEAPRNREKVGTTGIGGEVAIPHAKIAGMGRVAAVLATHRDGLDFGSIDGAPVKVVFLIVRPAGRIRSICDSSSGSRGWDATATSGDAW